MEKYSERRRIGNLGEDLAEMFLVKHGFKTLDRNYLKKFGELDVVVVKNSQLRFIEVKSIVTRETISHESHTSTIDNCVSHNVSQISFTKYDFTIIVSHETENQAEEYSPEENVNFWKQKRMARTIETYLLEKGIGDDIEWQIDVITVKIDFFNKTATIKHIENVVFEI